MPIGQEKKTTPACRTLRHQEKQSTPAGRLLFFVVFSSAR